MINKESLELIKSFEGLVLTAYPDPGSKDGKPWTIGYGHTDGVKKGDKITKEQAEAFLIEDLVHAENVIKKHVKVELNENQYGALVSFIHNVGEGQFSKGSVKRYINEGRLAEVPGRMALYRMNDGKVMNGLVRRRAAEGALWMKAPAAVVKQEKIEAQGVTATPASTKKPFDIGAAGVVVTTVAGASDGVKKTVGNITSTFGIDPIWVFVAIVVGFAAWTVWSKWKGDK
jgi:lysozyme